MNPDEMWCHTVEGFKRFKRERMGAKERVWCCVRETVDAIYIYIYKTLKWRKEGRVCVKKCKDKKC